MGHRQPGRVDRGRARIERLHHFEAMGWQDRLELGERPRCPFPRGHLARAWRSGFLAAGRYLETRRQVRARQAKEVLLELRSRAEEDLPEGLRILRRRLEEQKRRRPAA